MTITITTREVFDAYDWRQFCLATGISEWAVSEGQLGMDEAVTLTAAQAVAAGILPAEYAAADDVAADRPAIDLDANTVYLIWKYQDHPAMRDYKEPLGAVVGRSKADDILAKLRESEDPYWGASSRYQKEEVETLTTDNCSN